MTMVLGLDPGLANCGWALVELLPGEGERVHAIGVVHTDKGSDKVTVSADQHRRGREIARPLGRLIAKYDVQVLAAEAMSLPVFRPKRVKRCPACNRTDEKFSPRTCAMIGRAWGAIDRLCEEHGLPLVEVHPKPLKRACTGKTSATKREVRDALRARYGGTWARQWADAGGGATLDEHAYDALGAVVATLDSEVMRMARRMAGPPPAFALTHPGEPA